MNAQVVWGRSTTKRGPSSPAVSYTHLVIRMESDAARREEYLSQLEKGMQSLGVNQHTGNDVLDTILSDKQLYCSQHQITLTIVADGARLDFIETMDICSIFGNALDNAIEGVEKLADPQQRLIRVAVYTQNVFLIIRVENYCTAQLSVVDGEYRTTKHDKDMHGYGIKSIRYTAEKYGGSVSADCSDNWFHLKMCIRDRCSSFLCCSHYGNQVQLVLR